MHSWSLHNRQHLADVCCLLAIAPGIRVQMRLGLRVAEEQSLGSKTGGIAGHYTLDKDLSSGAWCDQEFQKGTVVESQTLNPKPGVSMGRRSFAEALSWVWVLRMVQG